MSMNPRAQHRMTAWVECADELPAFFDGPILVHFKNGEIETVNCEDFFKPIPNGVDAEGEQLWATWAMEHPIGVTHWALCPHPPYLKDIS